MPNRHLRKSLQDPAPRPCLPSWAATGDFHSDEQPLLGSKPSPRNRISWPESTPPARLPGEPLLALCPRGPSSDPHARLASFFPVPRWVLPPPPRGMTQEELAGPPLSSEAAWETRCQHAETGDRGSHSPPELSRVPGHERGGWLLAMVTQLQLPGPLHVTPHRRSFLSRASPQPTLGERGRSHRASLDPRPLPQVRRPCGLESCVPLYAAVQSPRPLPLVSSEFVWWPWRQRLSL